MAARKLQNELDRTFKKVSEGVAAFEGIHEKIMSCNNPAQKEKLEDQLKKEIKKLQRMRDQIKTWAQMGDIKDKKPLQDNRKLIETQMERFKAVEKEMKTKAYSKEGLSAAAKKDPKEQEKEEMAEFLRAMMDELYQQIESREAEVETLQVGAKKSKKDTAKADRISELERVIERHKWHNGKLELVLRALENGTVETEQVKELEEGIKYYVENNQEVDFMEDDSIYDELDLQEDEEHFGMNNEMDRVSSQDAQSIQDDIPEVESKPIGTGVGKQKAASSTDISSSTARRSSTQMKSPLPALATLHTSLPSPSNGVTSSSMKPAPIPARAPGEGLKYASAAAAAAASDKNGVGIAPLPPLPNATSTSSTSGLAPLPAAAVRRTSSVASPHISASIPAQQRPTVSATPSVDGGAALQTTSKSPALSHTGAAQTVAESLTTIPQASEKVDVSETQPPMSTERTPSTGTENTRQAKVTNGDAHQRTDDTESVYFLPSSLQDLLESFEATKAEVHADSKQTDERLLNAAHASFPESVDAERPRHYKPQNPYPFTPEHYPQEPLPIFDDPRLFQKIDTDTLFYAFYYRQGTYQQFLAAKALKAQSWRFHKQYQTWFQRHEEPKSITEDYEQGTYRFFDYESTWMNRRKADFKFAYKFLEDDL
ncbi:hypothetical protein EJ05DRAFT_470218 [Pseudovirgaria hyperparasitica]|uniref:General negative regulator of transcription subunit n=1 Tax=Pseudovirgaria hyperparasitica TaxID=470096 RepID=A0A6A6VT65_9PEZI|nr:uncharacterized protein EJ05DRAFT_470218 [Pseudovirgaria hyperparasitica]KAF2753413.1 hypothetical protein EJ05DRAFT_470218 [Pseudovirgaria hyperparasitica]